MCAESSLCRSAWSTSHVLAQPAPPPRKTCQKESQESHQRHQRGDRHTHARSGLAHLFSLEGLGVGVCSLVGVLSLAGVGGDELHRRRAAYAAPPAASRGRDSPSRMEGDERAYGKILL